MAVYQFIVLLLFALLTCTAGLTAVAEFDQGGVVGTIYFERLENGSTRINTSFTSGVFHGWHVHKYPTDYTDDPATRCNGPVTGPHYDPTDRNGQAGANYTTVCNSSDPQTNPLMCEAGDLSGKFGPLELGQFSFIDSDPLLRLTGQYGIIGRSVVIHIQNGTRIACANIILQDDTPRIFVATFLGPIAGSIYFRQSRSEEVSKFSTFIHAKLFYTAGDDAIDTDGHLWSIHTNSLSILDYSQGVCNNLGPIFDPTEVGSSTFDCSPSDICQCVVGDLSSKLGTISINAHPTGSIINAWTDGNLHLYSDNINNFSIGLHAAGGGQDLLACANIVELPVTSAIANTLFTMSQRSPFDPTLIKVGVSIPAADYQITRDGNMRQAGNTMCYSDVTYQPFDPFQATGDLSATFDSNAVGNLSGKHMIEAGAVLSDTVLPLTNLYSALGHNLMVTPSSSSPATCETLSFESGSNVRIIRATAGFDSDSMSGYVRLMQTMTLSNTQYIPGPTLLYWQLRYTDPNMNTTVGHNWHVHKERTANNTSPSTECNIIVGGHFNPFDVDVGSDAEMQVCNESVGSRYQLRCELGDLSGKHGWLVIQSSNSPEETTVATDSNLPLTGHYTVLGRSIAIHSDTTPAVIIACANIEPDVLSTTTLRVAFPTSSVSMNIRVLLPAAIVDALNDDDVEYGEVLVYEVTTDFIRLGVTECNIVSLRFTDFDGGNPESIANRVRQLNQRNLPEMFQRGDCPQLDLVGVTSGGGPVVQPHLVLITFLLAVTIMLANILI